MLMSVAFMIINALLCNHYQFISLNMEKTTLCVGMKALSRCGGNVLCWCGDAGQNKNQGQFHDHAETQSTTVRIRIHQRNY